MKLFAFVIMPNHIHLIAQFSVDHTLAAIMRDFKRYTARHLINELKSRDDQRTLLRLRRLNQDPRQNLKVWEDDYDSRAIFSALVLQKKLDYIHLNPCQKTWHLADDPTEYIWSSARFYMADQPAIIPVNDVREFLAGDSAGA
jgi:REP element-mobilizing transposase RayT